MGGPVWRGPHRARPHPEYLTIPVTADFFATLGVAAQLGRIFKQEDLRGGCAVVLSNKFWKGPLGGAESVVGQTLSSTITPARYGA